MLSAAALVWFLRTSRCDGVDAHDAHASSGSMTRFPHPSTRATNPGGTIEVQSSWATIAGPVEVLARGERRTVVEGGAALGAVEVDHRIAPRLCGARR